MPPTATRYTSRARLTAQSCGGDVPIADRALDGEDTVADRCETRTSQSHRGDPCTNGITAGSREMTEKFSRQAPAASESNLVIASRRNLLSYAPRKVREGVHRDLQRT